MASLIIQEAANIFLGDDSPDNSKHLSLASFKLPDMEEITVDHHAGGAIGAVKIGGMGFQALLCTFKLTGWDPQAMSQFGLGSAGRQPYTMRGLLRDKSLANTPIAIRAILWGRLTKISADEYTRGNLLQHDHAIDEIWRYQLFYDQAEKYFYDFLTSEWRVDGVEQNADERSALGIA